MDVIKPINFIVAELCDNDFGYDLREAIRQLMDDAGGIDFCPHVAKEYIVEYIVSAHVRKTILRGQKGYSKAEHIRDYMNKIRVTFRDKLPTYDINGEHTINHEGGSAYYDVHRDEVYAL